MADYAISADITGDASGLIAALNEAQSSLSSFGSTATSVFAGFAGANMFSGLINGVEGLAGSMLSTASEFESYSTSLTTILNGIDNTGQNVASSFGGSTGKMALHAMQAADELIRYNQKVTEINENIATVMQGGNILQAQQDLYTKLDDLATQHSQKVQDLEAQISSAYQAEADREADRIQTSQDHMADLKSEHDVTVADKKEKFQQSLNGRMSTAEIKQLTAKFDKELKLDQDNFQRKYDREQEIQTRNLKEQSDRDKEQTTKAIDNINDRIAKENTAYNAQQEKLRDDSEKRIAQLAAENAKKLDMYKQQLASEEMAHKEHMARLAEQAASGGGGQKNTDPLPMGDPYKATKMSLEDMYKFINQFAPNAPFERKDILENTNLIEAMGFNAQKLLPVIGDISASFHKSMGTGTQAVMDALQGRLIMLRMQFGISREELEKFGAQFDSAGHLMNQSSFFVALERIRDAKFAGGMQREMGTFAGMMVNIKDKMAEFALAFMGISFDAEGNQIVKAGGLMSQLEVIVKQFMDYITAHREEISKFFGEMAQGIANVLKFMAPIIAAIVSFALHHQKLMAGVLVGIGVFIGLVAILGTVAIFFTLLGSPIVLIIAGIAALIAIVIACSGHLGAIAKIIIDILFPPLGILISLVIKVAKTFFDNFDGIKKGWDGLVHTVEEAVGKIMEFLGKLADKAKDALSHLNPFAHHSPSLVEQVDDGVKQIKEAYASLSSISIAAPNIGGMGGNFSTINNINSSTNSPNINMNNNFNINDQQSAQNLAAYLSFQLTHKGFT